MFPWHSVLLECALILLGGVIGAVVILLFTNRGRKRFEEVERATIGDVPNRGFRGAISDLGLGALLNMISVEKKSGVLTVWREDIIGHVTCRAGEVLSARMEVRRDSMGEEAVYALLGLSDGTFIFEPKTIPATSVPALKSVQHMLIEGARRADLAQNQRSSA